MVNEAIPYLFKDAKDIFLRTKVKDFLFNGVLIDCSSESAEIVCSSLDGFAPDTFRKMDNDRDWLFSMFNQLNNTEKGPFVIGRGMTNTSRGAIYQYMDEPTLGEIWPTEQCNMINGTDATMFQPLSLGQPTPQRVYVFLPDLCRSLYLEQENHTLAFGIPVSHYTITDRLFLAPSEFKCFCPRVKDPKTFKEIVKCTPAGTIDLTPCMNSPTIFSWPHFFQGDETLLAYVSGLNPSKDKHENFIEIEPTTGTPVKGAKRAQFNLFLRNLPTFALMSNITEGIMPIVWLEEVANLPPALQNQLLEAYKAFKFLEWAKYFLIGLGIFLLLVAAILYAKRDQLFCFAANKIEDMAYIRQESRNNIDNKFVRNDSDDGRDYEMGSTLVIYKNSSPLQFTR